MRTTFMLVTAAIVAAIPVSVRLLRPETDVTALYSAFSCALGIFLAGLAFFNAIEQRRSGRIQQIANTHAKVAELRQRATKLVAQISETIVPNCPFAWLNRGSLGWFGTQNAWRMVRDMTLPERERFARMLTCFAKGMQGSGGERGERGTRVIDIVSELESVLSEFDFWCARLRELRPEDLTPSAA